MGKTEITVGKHKNIPQDLRQSFKWTTSIKYLVCIISDNIQQIYKEGLILLLNNMKSALNKWMKKALKLDIHSHCAEKST